MVHARAGLLTENAAVKSGSTTTSPVARNRYVPAAAT
jgi:hypothetical protein